MSTITRHQLVEAVEYGIEQNQKSTLSTEFTDAEILMLRHVARTANEVARGSFEYWFADEERFIGCPLTQAGIYPIRDGSVVRSQHTAFWGAFDNHTRKVGGTGLCRLKVVG